MMIMVGVGVGVAEGEEEGHWMSPGPAYFFRVCACVGGGWKASVCVFVPSDLMSRICCDGITHTRR